MSALIAVASAFLGARLALHTFSSEKWWEVKMEAYMNILVALHHMNRDLAITIDAEYDGRDTEGEFFKKWSAKHEAAWDEIRRQVDLGEFLFSPSAMRILKQLLYDARGDANGSVTFGSAFLNLELGDLRRLSGDAAGAQTNYARARDELIAMMKDQSANPDLYEALSLVNCGLGERDTAMKNAEHAIHLLPVEKDALVGPNYEITRARIEAHFGDRERAIPALAHLLNIPSYLSRAIVRLDPEFDALRGDPRFEALIRTQ